MGTGVDIDDAGTSSNGREGNRIAANNGVVGGVGGGDSWRLQPQSPPDAALLTEVGKMHADRLAAKLNALTALVASCAATAAADLPVLEDNVRRARGVLEREANSRAVALSEWSEAAEGRRRRKNAATLKALREAAAEAVAAVDDDPATTTATASASPAASSRVLVGDVSARVRGAEHRRG